MQPLTVFFGGCFRRSFSSIGSCVSCNGVAVVCRTVIQLAVRRLEARRRIGYCTSRRTDEMVKLKRQATMPMPRRPSDKIKQEPKHETRSNTIILSLSTVIRSWWYLTGQSQLLAPLVKNLSLAFHLVEDTLRTAIVTKADQLTNNIQQY